MILNPVTQITDPSLLRLCIHPNADKSEGWAQQRLRLSASSEGGRLWRNNVGVAFDDSGRPIRYGLANDSAKANRELKSSDLIGVTPLMITHDMVGRYVGVFTSIEVKRPGWSYVGSPREEAQFKWLKLILSLGGIAGFSTGD